MSDPAVELELVGADEDAALTALDALRVEFALLTGGVEVVRRTWLDTFDWRLHRAGWVLEYREAAGATSLTMTSTSGERLSAQTPQIRWPSTVDLLPATPLSERLAAIASIRALMPVAGAKSAVQQVRVLNEDAKTVARVVVDRPTTAAGSRGQDGDAVAAHLSVLPVRGYGRQGRQVARLLSSVPGVGSNAASVFERALRAAGRRPRDYGSKVDITLDPAMPAAVAVATVLESFLVTLQVNVAGVVADLDTEFLHDLRVAVRRTRSVLKMTGDVLPEGLADRFGPQFKWLGDMTTPTRDLDVFLLGFERMAGDLRAADAPDLDPFHAHLVRRREVERRVLARRVQSRRFERMLDEWGSELAAVLVSAPGSGAGLTAMDLARERVALADRRVVKHGSAITTDSPAEQLHTLRKRCKELRYLLEIFASLHEPSAHRLVLKELKELQECLGDFQDSEVQREAISEFATQMAEEAPVPPATMLAMGELVARLDAHQRWAREDYAGRFARFMRPKNRQAVATLTGPASG